MIGVRNTAFSLKSLNHRTGTLMLGGMPIEIDENIVLRAPCRVCKSPLYSAREKDVKRMWILSQPGIPRIPDNLRKFGDISREFYTAREVPRIINNVSAK